MENDEQHDVVRQRFDVADAAPLLLDSHAAVTSWTPGAERLLGYPATEAVGRTAADLLLPEDVARLPELAERCRANGGWAGLLTARHRDGHPVRLMVRIVLAAEVPGQERWLVLLEDFGRAPGWDMSRGILEQEAFYEEGLSLAEDLVARAAVCIDNARRYTRERDAAIVLQRNLLPHRLPEKDAVEVAACYRPADELSGLGGDWYDVIPLSGARVALVVGEVPGHGIDAAAAMGQLCTAVRTLADLDLSPEEVLAHLDDLVVQAARDENAEAGASAADGHRTVGAGCCLYAVYDPVTGRCAMADAGHPVPGLVGPDGTVTFVELPAGPALGVGGLPFEAVELDLAEGTTIALHTDGLLQAEGAEGTGEGRVTDLEAARERLRRHPGAPTRHSTTGAGPWSTHWSPSVRRTTRRC